MSQQNPTKLLTIDDVVAEYRIGRTKLYEQLKAGSLKMVKVGRSTRIWREDVENWIKSLPSRSHGNE